MHDTFNIESFGKNNKGADTSARHCTSMEGQQQEYLGYASTWKDQSVHPIITIGILSPEDNNRNIEVQKDQNFPVVVIPGTDWSFQGLTLLSNCEKLKY